MANGYQSREIAPEPRSGLNNTGSDIAKGTILTWGTTQEEIAPASAATDPFAGVAGEDIADGEWGRVVARGTALVIFAAAQTIGARVTSDANGNAVAAVAGNAVLGIAREAGAAATLAEVELSGPGGLRMPG
jgi:hypothetical protein